MSEKQKREMELEQQQEQPVEAIRRWYGVDVSKDSFTVALYKALSGEMSETLEFNSNRKGVKSFLSWYGKLADPIFPSAIAMESTGCYSARLAELMLKLDSSLYVSICNARSVSYYIKSHSANKTDKSDAKFIARYGYDSQPQRIKVKSRDERLLRELVSERGKLVAQASALKSKDKTLDFKETKEINKKVLGFLAEQIKELEKRIEEVVRRSEEINAEIALMDTVPGIGRLSASVIYGAFGSLKQYTRKQLSALSGLCPKISQSGSAPAKSTLSKTGQSYVKIPQLKETRERLLARENSCKMTARCACMRKLLLIVKGVVDSGVPYDPNYQQKNPSNAA